MSELLWKPSEDAKKDANISKFISFVNERYKEDFRSYDDLYQWSINNIQGFWSSFWDFAGIRASKGYEKVVDDLDKFPGAKWFVRAEMNFAENLLKYTDDRTALVFKGETQESARMSYRELIDSVARLSKSLREIGVRPGDRVAAYMPNMIETVVGMLASTAIGGIWSSCGIELEPGAVLDRFGQIEPKILLTVDGYFYKGKRFETLSDAAEIAKKLPSVEKVIISRYGKEKPIIGDIPNSVHYDDFVSKEV